MRRREGSRSGQPALRFGEVDWRQYNLAQLRKGSISFLQYSDRYDYLFPTLFRASLANSRVNCSLSFVASMITGIASRAAGPNSPNSSIAFRRIRVCSLE